MTSYFNLKRKEQEELLIFGENKLSEFGENKLSKPTTNLLEKDIWLCWVLDVLFNIPDNRRRMAFKGGTSLSKVFNAIHRFSEDVDITLDYKSFDVKIEGDLLSASKSKRKLISDELKKKVKEYSNDVIRPKLDASIKEISSEYTLVVDDSGEKITLYYPSALSNSKGNEYVKESILIELGGRNVIEPSKTHKVEPYLSQEFSNYGVELPSPDVVVLSPNRTFWEKATLIHVACNRGLKQNAERLSRHWYDLVKLYENSDGIGKDAIKDVGLLKDVVEHKMVFFNYSDAHYEYCLNKKFNLLPNDKDMEELKKDYEKMLGAQLIYDENYTFEYIIEKIKEIQNELNCM